MSVFVVGRSGMSVSVVGRSRMSMCVVGRSGMKVCLVGRNGMSCRLQMLICCWQAICSLQFPMCTSIGKLKSLHVNS